VLSVQLGSARRAWLLLVAYVIVGLGFGLIWAGLRDWVAAVFCVAGLVGAARMIVLLRRRSAVRAQAVPVARGRASAQAANGALFVSLGHQTRGARVREGVVLIGPRSAAFVVVGGWTHLAWKLVMSLVRVRFRFVDLAIDIPTHGDLDQALQDAVDRHGGFIIDGDWTYASSQRWLLRPGGAAAEGIVWIERPPPESLTTRWLPVPPPTPERLRWIRNRVAAVAAVVVTVFGVVGLAAWRLTGDLDYLVAGLFYAALVGGSVVAAVIVAERRLAAASRQD
jgi:hypothetical protein